MAQRTIGEASVRVRPDTDGFEGEAANKIGGALKKVAAAAAAVLASAKVKDFFVSAVKGASDLNETASKTQVLFGASTDKVMEFAARAATSMGQSKQAVLDGAATFAIYGKGAGIAGDKLVTFSTGLSSLASDMASFSNTSPEEAIQAIGAAMRGESDPIEKYGVLLNESVLKQRALKEGIIKTTTAALTPQQRVLAVQKELYAQLGEQGSKTIGDFARTSTGLANQQRILTSNWVNMKAEVGGALLPVMTTLVTTMNDRLMPALQNLWATHGQQVVTWLQRVSANVGPGIGRLVDKVTSVDWPAVLDRAQQMLAKLGPALKEAGTQSSLFHDTVSVGGIVVKFLADHLDLVGKALPYIVAGYIAYNAAQAVSNSLQVVAMPMKALEIASNFRSGAAIRAHTAALMQNTAAQRVNTASQVTDNAATNVGILAKVRAVATTVAQRVATIATTVATTAWTAIQWLLNTALSANPIGIIVLAIAALVAGVIYAYNHSETFRKIVQAAFLGIKIVIAAVVGWITDVAWPFIVKWFNVWLDGAKLIGEFVITRFNKIVDFFTSLPGRIGDSARNMWTGIVESAKGAVNKVISIWNSLDLGFSVNIPDWIPPPFGGKRFSVPDLFPDLPLLAKGGLIKARRGGTAAVMGEAGQDEFAVPMDIMRRIIAEAVAAGGRDVNVQIIADHPAIAAFLKFLRIVIGDELDGADAAAAGGVRF